MIRIQITDGSGPCNAVTLASVDFVQVRKPGLNARELATCVRNLLIPGRPRVLVNDRADVAIACGAHGVHLRDHSISPERIRRIAPSDFIISVACHDAESVHRAAIEGADYALLAPIFAPLSKSAERSPLGLEKLAEIAAIAKIPVIALSGITEENAQLCMNAGAAGIAAITLFRHSTP